MRDPNKLAWLEMRARAVNVPNKNKPGRKQEHEAALADIEASLERVNTNDEVTELDARMVGLALTRDTDGNTVAVIHDITTDITRTVKVILRNPPTTEPALA